MRSDKCNRCEKKLTISETMSWFTLEILCNECSDLERRIRFNLPNNGYELKGCGFVPDGYFSSDGEYIDITLKLKEENDRVTPFDDEGFPPNDVD